MNWHWFQRKVVGMKLWRNLIWIDDDWWWYDMKKLYMNYISEKQLFENILFKISFFEIRNFPKTRNSEFGGFYHSDRVFQSTIRLFPTSDFPTSDFPIFRLSNFFQKICSDLGKNASSFRPSLGPSFVGTRNGRKFRVCVQPLRIICTYDSDSRTLQLLSLSLLI
jgi:hypothetical protein